MEPARSIGKLGFRRWHERHLMESHAWLVTAFLCLIGVAACLEALSFRGPPFEGLLMLALAFTGGFVGWHALQRYIQMMGEAQHLAERSTCKECGTYGVFHILREAPRMNVRCRKCGHDWTIS